MKYPDRFICDMCFISTQVSASVLRITMERSGEKVMGKNLRAISQWQEKHISATLYCEHSLRNKASRYNTATSMHFPILFHFQSGGVRARYNLYPAVVSVVFFFTQRPHSAKAYLVSSIHPFYISLFAFWEVGYTVDYSPVNPQGIHRHTVQAYSHMHTYGQLRVCHKPTMQVSGVWEEAGVTCKLQTSEIWTSQLWANQQHI